MSYARFAIYYLPPDGALAAFGAAWLGWDVLKGCAAELRPVPGLEEVTRSPRKYGFHATLKPPFRLQSGAQLGDLEQAVADLSTGLAPASCPGLRLTQLGRFLALTPEGDGGDLGRVAAACVQELDAFRAPASDAELARRRKARLSARQDALLCRWGYPYVCEEFRFHMTLTGRLDPEDLPVWTKAAQEHLPALPRPFALDQIALCGERAEDGRFELLHRYTLSG